MTHFFSDKYIDPCHLIMKSKLYSNPRIELTQISDTCRVTIIEIRRASHTEMADKESKQQLRFGYTKKYEAIT